MAKRTATRKTTATKRETPQPSEVPVTPTEFHANAKPLEVKIGNDSGGGHDIAMPRTFSSGSLGWYTGGKMLMPVNGKQVKCQVSCSIVVVGTKPQS